MNSKHNALNKMKKSSASHMKSKSKVYFGSEPSKKDIQREIEDNKYEKRKNTL